MKINWKFLGEGGSKQKKTFVGGSMDIFWNCTMTIVFLFSGATVVETNPRGCHGSMNWTSTYKDTHHSTSALKSF